MLHFADDLDDPAADLTVAALAHKARAQGRQLKAVLSALARSVELVCSRARLTWCRRVDNAQTCRTRRGSAGRIRGLHGLLPRCAALVKLGVRP